MSDQEWTIQRHWQHWECKTQDDEKQNTKTQKTKTNEQHGHHQKPGVNPGTHEW